MKQEELIINGTILSPGIAIGQAFFYHDILTRDLSSYSITVKDVPYELKRITNAFAEVRKELYELERTVSQNINSKDGSIFKVQRLMMEDEQFVNSFETEMRNELINAEQVAKNVFRRQIDRLDETSSEVTRAKSDDLRDILRKVLRSLVGIETSILRKLPYNAIIVARRLLPSDTVKLDYRNVEGIVVQEGSVHAHSALLARSLGIPAICTNGIPVKAAGLGDNVIIDGYSERAIFNPCQETVQNHHEKKMESTLEIKKRITTITGQVKTLRGRTIQVLANASTFEEVNSALKFGCDGIGLFRTETLYFQRKCMLTEDDLYDILNKAVEPVSDMPVTIRLLDIGGDKRLPYFEFEEDFSPFLGVRGIRLLFQNQELLKTQIRALLRLRSTHQFRMLLPMVSIPEEIHEVKKIIRQCRDELGLEENTETLQIGAMIETPSSAIAIDKIIDISDFISIGTNDLTQYIMAASRENPNVAGIYEKGFGYILPLIANIAGVCKKNDMECCVCGEMANDETLLPKFIECGIDQFSVSSFRIPFIKNYIRRLTI
jgi:phosphoenolpyruvate-protein phosphotransferase (PTS system enzyme I)